MAESDVAKLVESLRALERDLEELDTRTRSNTNMSSLSSATSGSSEENKSHGSSTSRASPRNSFSSSASVLRESAPEFWNNASTYYLRNADAGRKSSSTTSSGEYSNSDISETESARQSKSRSSVEEVVAIEPTVFLQFPDAFSSNQAYSEEERARIRSRNYFNRISTVVQDPKLLHADPHVVDRKQALFPFLPPAEDGNIKPSAVKRAQVVAAAAVGLPKAISSSSKGPSRSHTPTRQRKSPSSSGNHNAAFRASPQTPYANTAATGPPQSASPTALPSAFSALSAPLSTPVTAFSLFRQKLPVALMSDQPLPTPQSQPMPPVSPRAAPPAVPLPPPSPDPTHPAPSPFNTLRPGFTLPPTTELTLNPAHSTPPPRPSNVGAVVTSRPPSPPRPPQWQPQPNEAPKVLPFNSSTAVIVTPSWTRKAAPIVKKKVTIAPLSTPTAASSPASAVASPSSAPKGTFVIPKLRPVALSPLPLNSAALASPLPPQLSPAKSPRPSAAAPTPPTPSTLPPSKSPRGIHNNALPPNANPALAPLEPPTPVVALPLPSRNTPTAPLAIAVMSVNVAPALALSSIPANSPAPQGPGTPTLPRREAPTSPWTTAIPQSHVLAATVAAPPSLSVPMAEKPPPPPPPTSGTSLVSPPRTQAGVPQQSTALSPRAASVAPMSPLSPRGGVAAVSPLSASVIPPTRAVAPIPVKCEVAPMRVLSPIRAISPMRDNAATSPVQPLRAASGTAADSASAPAPAPAPAYTAKAAAPAPPGVTSTPPKVAWALGRPSPRAIFTSNRAPDAIPPRANHIDIELPATAPRPLLPVGGDGSGLGSSAPAAFHDEADNRGSSESSILSQSGESYGNGTSLGSTPPSATWKSATYRRA